MLKIAIVGCGKIADSHAMQIQRIPGCEIAAVCDQEELMAKQLFQRFPVKHYFTDLDRLLDEIRPDVVHITTPPQSHLPIGLKCLESGSHILVEKPFTMDTKEAEVLLNAADRLGRKVTVGHDAQFSDVSRRMRKMIRVGYIGEKPVHLESYWCYDLSDVAYARSMLDDKQHWTRKLPGGLLHNIINHGIAKIAEFLTEESPRIIAHGFVSPFLRKLGEEKLIDELRVIIHEERGTTAYFTFSSQMHPALNQFRIYGTKNGIMIDEDRRFLIRLNAKNYKSYANHFIPPVLYAGEYLQNLFRNIYLFLKMDFHMDSGKKYLFESFYRSIIDDTPMPIPYREILLTSRIMDTIFDQIKGNRQP